MKYFITIRVPVPVGSLVDVVFETEKDISIKCQYGNEKIRGGTQEHLYYEENPIVSQDIVKSVFIKCCSSLHYAYGQENIVQRSGKLIDNEWGYSARVEVWQALLQSE